MPDNHRGPSWCQQHQLDGGSDFCTAWIEIPGVGWVQLSHVTGEGTVAYVTDPKRGFYDNDTRGLYEIDDMEAVALAYLEAVRIARRANRVESSDFRGSDDPSAFADASCEKGVH